MKTICSPLDADLIKTLRAGDEVFLNGTMFTARDAAHLRVNEHILKHQQPPFSLHHQLIYYSGPSPSSPKRKVGSIGPTTSSRMDAFSEPLLQHGLKGMVGKGERSKALQEWLVQYQAIYFVTIGGAGSLLSQCVEDIEPYLYEDLGPEAIYRLNVNHFPLYVAYDIFGGSIFR